MQIHGNFAEIFMAIGHLPDWGTSPGSVGSYVEFATLAKGDEQ